MQTKNLMKWLTGGVVVLVLIASNISIYQKEQVLKYGQIMILELAPVDPRSLMQGDYMALDYVLTRPLLKEKYKQCRQSAGDCKTGNGKIIIELDAQHHANRASFDNRRALQPQEILVKYHIAANSLSIGTSSYFFQEGHAERFSKARYGEFRVADDGTALLIHLLDEQGKRIAP